MKRTILILAGLSLFAAGSFAKADILGNGISDNQRSQYATKSIHRFIMNLKQPDEHSMTIRGTGFFIDSTSLDTFDVHDCRDNIRIVTTRDATLYTLKPDASKNRKADTSIEFDIEKRLDEYNEVDLVSLFPKMFDRDITANIAILDLSSEDIAWFKDIPERLRPKCIGLGTRGVEKAPDAATTLYGYTESMLSPSEISLRYTETVDLSKKFISLGTGYVFAPADGRKVEGAQSLKGSIVLNQDHQTPAGVVVNVTDAGQFQVASVDSIAREIRYLTTVTEEQKRIRYAFTYLPGTEEIEYKGIRFNELSQRLVYRFGLPTNTLIEEYNRVSQLPSSPDNQAYLNMIKSLNPEEMRRQNFDTTRVAVSAGIAEGTPLSGSLARIMNLGDIDAGAKVLVHKVNQNSIATLFDLMVVLKADQGMPARSTLDQTTSEAAAMNISVKPLDGEQKFYVTGSYEKDTWNSIHSKMDGLISDYKDWLVKYVAKNKPSSYYSDPYASSTGGYSSGGTYSSTPATPPPPPKGWGLDSAGYQEVTFVRLKAADHYSYSQEPTRETVIFAPEDSLLYVNRLMDDYFKLMIGLDQIENNAQLSEDRKNTLVHKARQDMLVILGNASQHADLIKSLHDGSNLINTSENSIEQQVLDLVRNLGELKASCNKDLERLSRQGEAIKRYNQ